MIAFIVTHLWQSTLVALAAWLLAWACRREAAAVRYWIWLVASIKFLVPRAVLQRLGDSVGRSMPEPLLVDAGLVERANAVFVPSMPQALELPNTLPSQLAIAAVTIWAVGAALLFIRWVMQWQAVRSRLAFAPQISLDFAVPIRVAAGDLPTGVFGIFRPVVIVPRDVMQALEPQQLRAVLAHEACHVRRLDNLTAAIHHVVAVLFWFHPLVWWIGANLLRERESACDEAVVDEGHEQTAYAESILTACRVGVMARFAPVAATTGGDLHARLSSILSEHRAPPISRKRFTLLFAAATLMCFAPLAVGIAVGSLREASGAGPGKFEVITLKPAAPGWWRSSRFEPDSGRLVVRNFSLRDLIVAAYPASIVNADRLIVDSVRYDIEARWSAPGDTTGISERNTYRQLLQQIVEANSNYELYVTDLY
jgi:bla regulator protein BlaR1